MGRKCHAYVAMLVMSTVLVSGLAGCKNKEEENTPGLTGTPNATVTAGAAEGQGNETVVSGVYTQAPMLQNLVDARKLPVLEKRLPVQSDVVTESGTAVGAYGEEVQFAAENADTITGELVSEGLFRYAQDGTIAPNIAKSYTVNSDFTKYTIYLREGMCWSDGVPFTSDDCIFFYEKMCLPETFGEPLWQCFSTTDANGKKAKAVFRKLDSYSFEVIFSSSKPEFLAELLEQGGICFAPEHYHVNLLPTYMGEDAAKAKAQAMGYQSVEEMLKMTVVQAWNTKGVPTLNPYCLSSEEGADDVKGNYYEFVRNPYYWKVDARGQQLPYLNRLGFTRISGESQKMLLTTEGFLSVSVLTAAQVAEAQASAERGEYRIIPWPENFYFAVKNTVKNFPEGVQVEEKTRGVGAAHVELWYVDERGN